MGILVTGSGIYPSVFFSRNFSYPFTEFDNVDVTSNQGMLKHSVDFLGKNGYQVFVRDASFLGFPSYHIVIPGLSEIETMDDVRSIRDYADFNKYKKLVRSLGKLDENNREVLIGILEKMNYNRDASIMDLMNLPFHAQDIPWYYSKAGLFIVALHYWRGDTVKAYEAFDQFLHSVLPTVPHRGVITYYKCVRDYLGTKIDGLSEKDAISLLSTFYSLEVIHGVVSEFNTPTKIISYQGQLNCWNCKACRFSEACLYPRMEYVYKIFKDQYAANPVDQKILKDLL
jgi:ribosomal protein S12 methylthiotransferase accessory factor